MATLTSGSGNEDAVTDAEWTSSDNSTAYDYATDVATDDLSDGSTDDNTDTYNSTDFETDNTTTYESDSDSVRITATWGRGHKRATPPMWKRTAQRITWPAAQPTRELLPTPRSNKRRTILARPTPATTSPGVTTSNNEQRFGTGSEHFQWLGHLGRHHGHAIGHGDHHRCRQRHDHAIGQQRLRHLHDDGHGIG